MTDQVAVVQGQPEPTAQPVTTAPPVEPAPAQPTQAVVQEKYGGKTLEQLAQELEEKDSYISSVNERAARAEHEAILTRNLVEQFARDKEKPQGTQIAEPEFSDDAYLTNPVKVTSAMLDKKLERYFSQEREARDRERATQTVMQTRDAFERGKQAAFKSNPQLFKGIEYQVEQELTSTIGNAIRNGQHIDPKELENPNYWAAAAAAYRIYRGEDLSKYYAKSTQNPVAPGHTEVPSPGGAPQVVASLSREQEEAARAAGFTREQFAEMWGKQQAEKARRAQ